MRIKLYRKNKKKLVTGTERVKERFLWFPLIIEKELRWFEKTKYKQIVYNHPIKGYGWINDCWIN